MNPIIYLLMLLADQIMPAVRTLTRLLVLLVRREYHRRALIRVLQERQALLALLLEMTALQTEMNRLTKDMTSITHAETETDRKRKCLLQQRAQFIQEKFRLLEARAHVIDPSLK